jgi:hypothetical protein
MHGPLTTNDITLTFTTLVNKDNKDCFEYYDSRGDAECHD